MAVNFTSRASSTAECANHTISCFFQFTLYSLLPWGSSISSHYAERDEPLGMVNEIYLSMEIYTYIYIAREIIISRHHDGIPFQHVSIIILVKIHVKYINLLPL